MSSPIVEPRRPRRWTARWPRSWPRATTRPETNRPARPQPPAAPSIYRPGYRTREREPAPPFGATARRPGADRHPALMVAGATVGLIVISTYLRTRAIGSSLWVDEGLTVGISHHALSQIPSLLREDGSPPLYYLLLHAWMSVFGDREARVHALSLVFALLCIPVSLWAAWSVFGRRAGAIAALLFAVAPFLTDYGQEARMYSLVVLLGLITSTAWVQAFVLERRRYLPLFSVALAAMLYTHAWSDFFALGAVAGLGPLLRRSARRRALTIDALLAFAGAGVLFAPWLPTLLYTARHTGAPWADHPSLSTLRVDFTRLIGGDGVVAVLLLGVGCGLAACRTRDRPHLTKRSGQGWPRWEDLGDFFSPRSRPAAAMMSLLLIAAVTMAVGVGFSEVSRAYTYRYLGVLLAPLLLLAAGALSRARGVGLAALLIAVVSSLGVPPTARLQNRSNVGRVTRQVSGVLSSGDLVLSDQPEQVATLRYYLGPRLRYATALGLTADPQIMDWRDATQRLRALSPQVLARALSGALEPGQHLLEVSPLGLQSATAPWTSLVRQRTRQFMRLLAADHSLKLVRHISPPYASGLSPVQARLYVKR